MRFKRFKAGPLALATVLSAYFASQAHAQDNPLPGSFSANVTLTSDYIIRGISMTDEAPAIQGGLDWQSDSGFYVGTWGSNVEFGNDASAEIDFYAGFRGAYGAFNYEIGASYYWYPATSAPGLSFWDAHVDAGYNFGPAAVTLGLAYSPDNFGPAVNDAALYTSAEFTAPVAEMMTLRASVGYSALEGVPNYIDWNAGATFHVYDWFNLDVRYFDTDYTAICGTACDARVVVKISRVF